MADLDVGEQPVKVGDIHDFGGGVRGANFADPDGNTFELQEMAWRRGATY